MIFNQDFVGPVTRNFVLFCFFFSVEEDECVTGMANCADGAACKDTLYGYKCVCPPSTYTYGDARKIPCSDVDECKDWKNCVAMLSDHSDGQPGVCVNFYGGYNCECVPGYFKFFGDGRFITCYKNPSECDRKPVSIIIRNFVILFVYIRIYLLATILFCKFELYILPTQG